MDGGAPIVQQATHLFIITPLPPPLPPRPAQTKSPQTERGHIFAVPQTKQTLWKETA